MEAFSHIPVWRGTVGIPRRFYRVQHYDSHTSQVGGRFEAAGQLTAASTSGMPHWLDPVYLRRQLAAPDLFRGREGSDYWAGRQPPYISVFIQKSHAITHARALIDQGCSGVAIATISVLGLQFRPRHVQSDTTEHPLMPDSEVSIWSTPDGAVTAVHVSFRRPYPGARLGENLSNRCVDGEWMFLNRIPRQLVVEEERVTVVSGGEVVLRRRETDYESEPYFSESLDGERDPHNAFEVGEDYGDGHYEVRYYEDGYDEDSSDDDSDDDESVVGNAGGSLAAPDYEDDPGPLDLNEWRAREE